MADHAVHTAFLAARSRRFRSNPFGLLNFMSAGSFMKVRQFDLHQYRLLPTCNLRVDGALMARHFNAIVAGSGIGELIAGVLHALAGRRGPVARRTCDRASRSREL
jgi:hypothetical protein